MIAKGVPAGTILQLTVTLLPQALALTIPMALLIGLLVGLGRLSADREFVVMMACGISPYRLLHPILVFAVVCWGAHVVGDAEGHARRQPGVPRDQHARSR